MTEQEKVEFLGEKLKELNAITSEMEAVFPEKSFKLDGILIGNIVEVLTAHVYGITLYRQSEKTHDGEVNGKKVQIKGTQGNDYIIIREVPEYLLVEYLDHNTGTIQEIYNGPGDIAWQAATYVPSMNHYTMRVNRLIELDQQISDEQRIAALMPISKYVKTVVRSEKLEDAGGKFKRKPGKTLIAGYVNRNNQENKGCLNKPGNHYNQMAYLLHCNNCGFEYEANGCDVAIRKCPKCM
jgi:hypothetical protein